MTIVLVIRLMAKYGHYGHFHPNMAIMAIFGHKPYDHSIVMMGISGKIIENKSQQ